MICSYLEYLCLNTHNEHEEEIYPSSQLKDIRLQLN